MRNGAGRLPSLKLAAARLTEGEAAWRAPIPRVAGPQPIGKPKDAGQSRAGSIARLLNRSPDMQLLFPVPLLRITYYFSLRLTHCPFLRHDDATSPSSPVAFLRPIFSQPPTTACASGSGCLRLRCASAQLRACACNHPRSDGCIINLPKHLHIT